MFPARIWWLVWSAGSSFRLEESQLVNGGVLLHLRGVFQTLLPGHSQSPKCELVLIHHTEHKKDDRGFILGKT